MLVTIDLEYSIEMLIIYYVAKCLSVIIHYSFIYIYLVTLTLYEEIDKDMVTLPITTCSDAHCSLSLAFPSHR
jgi:hypothetical protein